MFAEAMLSYSALVNHLIPQVIVHSLLFWFARCILRFELAFREAMFRLL